MSGMIVWGGRVVQSVHEQADGSLPINLSEGPHKTRRLVAANVARPACWCTTDAVGNDNLPIGAGTEFAARSADKGRSR